MTTTTTLEASFPLFQTESTSNYRPFRRHRNYLYNNWGKLLSNCWHSLKTAASRTQQFSKSLLGTTIIYITADTVGSLSGEAIGSSTVAKVSSCVVCTIARIGVPTALIISSGALACRANLSRADKVRLGAIVITSLALTSFNIFGNYGSALDLVFQKIGAVAGTILGGYAGLWIVGSPTVFYDQQNPWNSYSVSSLRFLAVGMVFENAIVYPTMPLIGHCLRIPRAALRITLQNIAYNSNTLIPLVQESIRERNFGKPRIPIIIHTAVNTYCGNNSKFLTQKFSKLSMRSIFPKIVYKQFHLIKCDNLLSSSLTSKVEPLLNSKKIATKAISAFHGYMQILTKLKKLADIHKNLQEAILKNKSESPKYKKQITEMICDKILLRKNATWESFVSSIIDYSWQTENARQLMKTLHQSIRQAEIGLFGFSLINKQQSAYINEILEIHLKHYLIYLLLNYNELPELTQKEENESITALVNIVFSHYVDSLVPPFLAKASRKTINTGLHLTFKLQELISVFFVQPEQSSFQHVPTSEIIINENHAGSESEQSSHLVTKLEIKEDYKAKAAPPFRPAIVHPSSKPKKVRSQIIVFDDHFSK